MFIHVILLFCFGFISSAVGETLTLPHDQRPGWFNEDGIVMAGSWEPLLFRVRRDGSDGYEPTPEQRAAYKREHSQEMVEQLKSLGVNFVMMHCYKGFGLGNERDSMADAVQFSKLCHENGLRVGVYVYSGAFGWELLFPETPEAKDWVVLKPNGDPAQYGSATYRYYWNRNHPAAQAFYKNNIVQFAVERIQTDLIHFDNYSVGPGHDANSIQRFRNYLRTRFNTDTLKRNGIDDVNTVLPPGDEAPIGFLRYAWNDFSCQSLADSYYEMGSYARSLRKDVLLECNPGGVGGYIRSPIDHGRLLGGGEAFWDEGRPPGVREGVLHNRIRTYKTARRMDNMAFAYCTTPLEMAESMAFNLNCLGCVVWFEYGKMVEKPGSDQPVSEALAPYIQFFHTRREIFRDTRVIADVAVLRSFPSQSFADHKYSQLTNEAEQTLIENRIPFQIVYDQHLKDLNPYRVLVLAGCVALSDSHIHQITKFVQEGGHLCLLGSVGIYDEWMTTRKEQIFNDVPLRQLTWINSASDLTSAIQKASHKGLSMDVQAPFGLCAELTESGRRRFLHLVNYHPIDPVADVQARIRLPKNKTVQSILLANPLRETDRSLHYHVEDGIVSFTIPKVETYEIAIVTYNDEL